jgi:hypothetical protein
VPQMPGDERKSREKKPELHKQLPQTVWFWWLVFATLLAWNLFAWWPEA